MNINVLFTHKRSGRIANNLHGEVFYSLLASATSAVDIENLHEPL